MKKLFPFKLPVKQIGVLLCIIMLTMVINSCRKDRQYVETPLPAINDLESIKQSFLKTGYSANLSQKVSDSLQILWNPDWPNAIKKIKNDTSYCYIPLDGELQNVKTGRSKKLNTINTDKYLLCVIGQKSISFSLATYITKNNTVNPTVNSTSKAVKPSVLNHATSFNNFTGTLILKNLANNTKHQYGYLNGHYQPVAAPSTNNVGRLKTMGYQETNCQYYVVCTWLEDDSSVQYCGGGTGYEESSGADYCVDPDNNYNGCWVYWDLISSNIEQQCDYTWVPDPPPPPDATPNQPMPQPIIDSINSKFPCAKQILAAIPGLQTNLSTLLNATFNSSTPFTVVFHDGDSTFYASHQDEDGDTKYDNGVNSIYINPNILAHASNEYILVTMYHEALHAYLNVEYTTLGDAGFKAKYPAINIKTSWHFGNMGNIIDDFWIDEGAIMTQVDSDPQHRTMAEYFTSSLINAILAYNPSFDPNRAKDLARWGIFKDSSASQSNVQEKDMRNGESKGTTCPK